MSDLVFPAPPPSTVAIAGSQERFPVRRIFCVGRNYAAHAAEMGHDAEREPPFFFTKPADAVVDNHSKVPYPPETNNLHFEIELVVAVGKGGINIPESEALEVVFGYAVGLDMTRRDLQTQAKKMGRPWDWGKAFDHSAPCGPISRTEVCGHPLDHRIWLTRNGEIQQEASTAELIWSVPEVISILSSSMELKPGDLIYSGTPAGVGPTVSGDRLAGGVDGLVDIEVEIA
ncbi:MAG: fumarylacetoacetate hydrolase family protein [Pseudomonadota bacterium]